MLCKSIELVIVILAEDGGSRSKVYEEYTLRQDKNSQWKIVFWDVIPETSVEGD